MTKVTGYEKAKTISEIERDLNAACRSYLEYKKIYGNTDRDDRDETVILLELRLLSEELLRWRIL